MTPPHDHDVEVSETGHEVSRTEAHVARAPGTGPDPEPPPPFSDAELRRRHEAVAHIAAEAGCDRVVAYGANRSGSAVPWLTRWSVTREAAVIVEPDEPDLLVVQFHNHVPLARELARDAEVRWGGASTAATLVDELRRRGGDRQRIGLIGEVPFPLRDALADAVGPPVDLTAAYVDQRLVKSDEELAHLRHGAVLSDAALEALATGLVPGRTDHELIDRIESAYVPHGGTTHIHYLGITSMADPQRAVPAQQPIGAVVEPGSVVVTELSAAYRGYAGQVLRTFSVGAPLDGCYRELHDVAQTAFDRILDVLRDGVTPAEVAAAAHGVREAGFVLCDDLLHGFGGGYLPPVIGRLDEPVPDLPLRSGMTVVVQPNVTTLDGRAGVQTGELVVITDTGYERLHAAPPGPIEVEVPVGVETGRAEAIGHG